MKKIQLIKLQQVDHIYNEIKILNSLDHKFIVYFCNSGKIRRDYAR
jgi:hypothetical protein